MRLISGRQPLLRPAGGWARSFADSLFVSVRLVAPVTRQWHSLKLSASQMNGSGVSVVQLRDVWEAREDLKINRSENAFSRGSGNGRWLLEAVGSAGAARDPNQSAGPACAMVLSEAAHRVAPLFASAAFPRGS